MTTFFCDPRARQAIAQRPYDLALDLQNADSGVVLGLLANGFPDSVAFLDAVGEALLSKAPGIELCRYDKGNASLPASGEMLDGISKECKAVVAAYGH